ncbi:hypothetical protein ERJ75_000501800 [Trypanosoma vivax]|nr:hypothetical protein ERJ75_000501800 [Trypanosoma vivax]
MVARVEALGRDCFQHCILDALQAMHLAHTMFLTSLVTHPRRAASWLLHCVARRTSGQLVASWLGGSVALLSWSTYFSPCLSLVNSKASNTGIVNCRCTRDRLCGASVSGVRFCLLRWCAGVVFAVDEGSWNVVVAALTDLRAEMGRWSSVREENGARPCTAGFACEAGATLAGL